MFRCSRYRLNGINAVIRPVIIRRSISHTVASTRTELVFTSVEEACNVFRESSQPMNEQQAMTGFHQAFTLALAEVRRTPHVLSAASVARYMKDLSGYIEKCSLSPENLALVVEGLSRLEIDSTALLKGGVDLEKLLFVLNHCVSRDVRSTALLVSAMNVIPEKFGTRTDEELLSLLALLTKVAVRDVQEASFGRRFLSGLSQRIQLLASNVDNLPVVMAFLARTGQHEANKLILHEMEQVLLMRPTIVAKISPHVILTRVLLDELFHQLVKNGEKFPVASLVGTLKVISRLPKGQEATLKAFNVLFSRCPELCKDDLVTLLSCVRCSEIEVSGEDILEALSYVSQNIDACNCFDLADCLELVTLYRLDAEVFVSLVAEEITTRIGFEKEQQAGLPQLMLQLHRWSTANHNRILERLLVDLLTSDPICPIWVFRRLVYFLSSRPALLGKILPFLSVSNLHNLPLPIFMNLFNIMADSSASLNVAPFAEVLLNRVDEMDSAFDIFTSISTLIPLSDKKWLDLVRRILSSSSGSHQHPEKWLNLLKVLPLSSLKADLAKHLTSTIRDNLSLWPVKYIVAVITSMSSSNIQCTDLVSILSGVPNVSFMLEELPLTDLVHLAHGCGHVCIALPLCLQQALLPEELLACKVALHWSKLVAGSADVKAYSELLSPLAVSDMMKSSIDTLVRLHQLDAHLSVEGRKNPIPKLEDRTAHYVKVRLYSERMQSSTASHQALQDYLESNSLLGSHVLANCITTGSIAIDYALQVNGSNEFIPWQDCSGQDKHSVNCKYPLTQRVEFSEVTETTVFKAVDQVLPDTAAKRVAVLVLDENEAYVHGSKKLVGEVLVRVWQLKTLGWHTIMVPRGAVDKFCVLSRSDSSMDFLPWLLEWGTGMPR